jgi:hypothetical protein
MTNEDDMNDESASPGGPPSGAPDGALFGCVWDPPNGQRRAIWLQGLGH